MPTGFCHFDECGPGVFVTKLEGTRPIEEIRPFEFKEENAQAVAFTHDKKMDTCYEVRSDCMWFSLFVSLKTHSYLFVLSL
jgi:hypothetical protein